MNRMPFTCLLLCTLAACAPDAPTEDVGDTFAVEHLERQFTFDAPVPTTLYVHSRRVSYAGRTAEYDVEVGQRRLAVVYQVLPDEPLPLVTSVYDETGLL